MKKSEAIGFTACWKFDEYAGRCRMPEGHKDDCVYYWYDTDGEKPVLSSDQADACDCLVTVIGA